MSHYLKINSAILAVIMSSLGAWGSVVWIASSKAADITAHAEELRKVEGDIRKLQDSDRSTQSLLQRLDERTSLILETVRAHNNKP